MQAAEILYKELTSKYLEDVIYDVWLSNKMEKIKLDFESGFSQIVDFRLRNQLINLLNKLNVVFNKRAEFKTFSLSISHGDFQYANILLRDNGKLIFIDWESVDKRWFAYDYFTLFLESRMNAFIGYEKFKSVVSGHVFLKKLLKMNQNREKEMYLLYSLEELHYQVLNRCEPIFYNPGEGLGSYLNALNLNLEQFQD